MLKTISPPSDVFLIEDLQTGWVIMQMQSFVCQKEQPWPLLFPNILSALVDGQPFCSWAIATSNPITVTFWEPVGKHPFLLLINFLLITLSYSLFSQRISVSGCFKPFQFQNTVELQHNQETVISATRKHQLKGQSQPMSWLPASYEELLCKGREGSFSPSFTTTAHEPYKAWDYCSNNLHRSLWCTAGQLSPCNSCQAGDNIASIISLKSIWCRTALCGLGHMMLVQFLQANPERSKREMMSETHFYQPACQTLDNKINW